MSDACQRLASEIKGRNESEIGEMTGLAGGETLAQKGEITLLEGGEGGREGGRVGMRGARGGRKGGFVRTRIPCPSSWICSRRMPPSLTVTTIDLAPASKLFSTSSCERKGEKGGGGGREGSVSEWVMR